MITVLWALAAIVAYVGVAGLTARAVIACKPSSATDNVIARATAGMWPIFWIFLPCYWLLIRPLSALYRWAAGTME